LEVPFTFTTVEVSNKGSEAPPGRIPPESDTFNAVTGMFVSVIVNRLVIVVFSSIKTFPTGPNIGGFGATMLMRTEALLYSPVTGFVTV
jgi:hypothetical protein